MAPRIKAALAMLLFLLLAAGLFLSFRGGSAETAESSFDDGVPVLTTEDPALVEQSDRFRAELLVDQVAEVIVTDTYEHAHGHGHANVVGAVPTTNVVSSVGHQHAGWGHGTGAALVVTDDLDDYGLSGLAVDSSPLPPRGTVSPAPTMCELPDDVVERTPILYFEGFEHIEGFEHNADEWVPLSGSWTPDSGSYRQSDAAGYDQISQLLLDLPAQYRTSVAMKFNGGIAGAGLVLGQPVPNSRNGATVVDVVSDEAGKSYLRWGRYDLNGGDYVYDGGMELVGFDITATHLMTIEVRSTDTVVIIDGQVEAMFGPVDHGRAGLVTHGTAVEFDDFLIEALQTV